jgi:uncharacterized protein (TIGR02145 family)
MIRIKSLLVAASMLAAISPLFSQTVTIGTQDWSTKNLDVSTFRNGDVIPEARSKEEWEAANASKQPAWCYYENDPINGLEFGKLYNWYAVSDPRGLAPAGWHVPTTLEWYELMNFLGGDENEVGKKLKVKSSWKQSDPFTPTGNENFDRASERLYENALKERTPTNESGFTAKASGLRDLENFKFKSEWTFFWTSTESDSVTAFCWYMYWNANYLLRTNFFKGNGFPVRCIKNK